MRSKIVKLKKREKSKGINGISGTHLSFASNLLLEHLFLLFQMIFVTGIVPGSFGVGLVHPILKKVNQLTSALHIVRSLFQLLFVSYLNPLFLMKLHFNALLRTTSSGSIRTQDGNTFTAFLQIFLLMQIKAVIFSSLERLM